MLYAKITKRSWKSLFCFEISIMWREAGAGVSAVRNGGGGGGGVQLLTSNPGHLPLTSPALLPLHRSCILSLIISSSEPQFPFLGNEDNSISSSSFCDVVKWELSDTHKVLTSSHQLLMMTQQVSSNHTLYPEGSHLWQDEDVAGLALYFLCSSLRTPLSSWGISCCCFRSPFGDTVTTKTTFSRAVTAGIGNEKKHDHNTLTSGRALNGFYSHLCERFHHTY